MKVKKVEKLKIKTQCVICNKISFLIPSRIKKGVNMLKTKITPWEIRELEDFVEWENINMFSLPYLPLKEKLNIYIKQRGVDEMKEGLK